MVSLGRNELTHWPLGDVVEILLKIRFHAVMKVFVCCLYWLPSPCKPRLLHKPSHVAVGLSVGYAAWSPINRHHPFMIGLSKYRFGIASVAMDYGLTWPVGIFTIVRYHWQSLCTALMACKCLPLGLCKETVKESIANLLLPCQDAAWRTLIRSGQASGLLTAWSPTYNTITYLTHWGQDKMASILWMKVLKFRLKFHWSLFPRIQSTIRPHWYR